MPRIIDTAKLIAAVVGALTATLTLIGWINTSFLDYMTLHFATVEQVSRIESKIDRLVGYADGIPQSKPDENRNASEPPLEIVRQRHPRRQAR